MKAVIREPFNALSHLLGALLSLIGLIFMTVKAAEAGSAPLHIAAVWLFGLSLIALYSASAAYHWAKAHDRVIAFLRKIDHSMIYALIAGSYAPFCLIALDGPLGWTLFGIVAALAISGILFKMVWFHSPRWLSTVLYIGMGWIIIFAVIPLSENLSEAGLFLLIAGGVLYTIGGIIYGLEKKVRAPKWIGFHEIFHVFILLGSLAHFASVYFFVI